MRRTPVSLYKLIFRCHGETVFQSNYIYKRVKENSDHTELTACIVKRLLNQPPCGVTIMLINLQSIVECVAFRSDVHQKFETKSKDNITFESSKITQGL